MWKIIASFLTGPISAISNDIKEAQIAKINAKNDAERIAADERIATLEARKASILAAQSDPFERFIRIGFAIPFIVYVNKIMIWDKVLKWGVTDNLSGDFYNILYIILAGYFVDAGIKRFRR